MSTQVMPWDELEPKFRVFAVMYAGNGDLKECAEHFSVTMGTCRAWSRKPAVAMLINFQIAKFEDASLVNKMLLERMALDIYDTAMGEEDSHGVTKDGGAYSAKQTNLAAASQAVGILHKLNHDEKALKVKSEEHHTGNVIININNASFNTDQHAELLASQGKEKVIEHE